MNFLPCLQNSVPLKIQFHYINYFTLYLLANFEINNHCSCIKFLREKTKHLRLYSWTFDKTFLIDEENLIFFHYVTAIQIRAWLGCPKERGNTCTPTRHEAVQSRRNTNTVSRTLCHRFPVLMRRHNVAWSADIKMIWARIYIGVEGLYRFIHIIHSLIGPCTMQDWRRLLLFTWRGPVILTVKWSGNDRLKDPFETVEWNDCCISLAWLPIRLIHYF